MRLCQVANGEVANGHRPSAKQRRCSGSEAIAVIGAGKDAHHLVEARNLEVENGAVLHQPFQYRSRGTKHLELDTVLACPAIEKREHPQAATANRFYLGKIHRNNSGSGLSQHNIAKLENCVARYDSAFAINHRQVVQILDVYG